MNNLDKYRRLLLDEDVDAILLTSEVARHYAAGVRIAEGMALLTAKGYRYFTDSRYIEVAENNLKDFSVREVTRGCGYAARLNEAVAELDIFRIGFEEEYITAGELARLSGEVNAEFVPFGKAIAKFREVKEPKELDCIRRAQAITDDAFKKLLPLICAGITEMELRTELIYLLYKCGADGLAFDPIVISGEKTSMPHGVAGERALSYGDFITMDFGASYGGYCADMTRTVALGFVTEEMAKVYDIVLSAQKAAIAATKAGVTGCEADAVARKIICDAGYGTYFGHGYGHGVGLEIHESPSCSPSCEQILTAGCVTSAEPGIYLPGRFGVRIEDLIVITDEGCENLTKSSKNLIIL